MTDDSSSYCIRSRTKRTSVLRPRRRTYAARNGELEILETSETRPHTGSVSAFAFGVGLGGKAYFIHWGWFQISAANLVVIAAMVIVFLLAVLAPFPRGRR